MPAAVLALSSTVTGFLQLATLVSTHVARQRGITAWHARTREDCPARRRVIATRRHSLVQAVHPALLAVAVTLRWSQTLRRHRCVAGSYWSRSVPHRRQPQPPRHPQPQQLARLAWPHGELVATRRHCLAPSRPRRSRASPRLSFRRTHAACGKCSTLAGQARRHTKWCEAHIIKSTRGTQYATPRPTHALLELRLPSVSCTFAFHCTRFFGRRISTDVGVGGRSAASSGVPSVVTMRLPPPDGRCIAMEVVRCARWCCCGT